MGLDMYLSADVYISGYDWESEEEKARYRKAVNLAFPKKALYQKAVMKDSPHVHIKVCIGYWRKANAVHKFFTDLVSEDNCREFDVSRENLEDLLVRCNRILSLRSEEKRKERAQELLPAQSGFFFGSTEYGEWYFEDLKWTKKVITEALKLPASASFSYRASW